MANDVATLTQNVAKEMGEGWAYIVPEPGNESTRHASMSGPNGQEVYFNNSRSGKDRVYVSGTFPQGQSLPYNETRPSITMDGNKPAAKMAADIKRRLLPEYQRILALVIERKMQAETFEANRKNVQAQVAMIVDGRLQGEMVYTGGWEIQVSGPDSIRFYGHCNYLTLEQLRKINQVCPELFRRKEE